MVKSLLACTVRRDKLADLRQNKLKQIKHFLKNVGKNNKRNKNEMRGVGNLLTITIGAFLLTTSYLKK